MEEVTAELAPLARDAGLQLIRPLARPPLEWRTDAALLRLVLRHLTLRALMGEVAPGPIRMELTLSDWEARLCVLARAGAQPAARHRALDGVSELSALRQLLAPLGGALAAEPRRAGYLPLTVILRATGPRDLCAAQQREAA